MGQGLARRVALQEQQRGKKAGGGGLKSITPELKIPIYSAPQITLCGFQSSGRERGARKDTYALDLPEDVLRFLKAASAQHE